VLQAPLVIRQGWQVVQDAIKYEQVVSPLSPVAQGLTLAKLKQGMQGAIEWAGLLAQETQIRGWKTRILKEEEEKKATAATSASTSASASASTSASASANASAIQEAEKGKEGKAPSVKAENGKAEKGKAPSVIAEKEKKKPKPITATQKIKVAALEQAQEDIKKMQLLYGQCVTLDLAAIAERLGPAQFSKKEACSMEFYNSDHSMHQTQTVNVQARTAPVNWIQWTNRVQICDAKGGVVEWQRSVAPLEWPSLLHANFDVLLCTDKAAEEKMKQATSAWTELKVNERKVGSMQELAALLVTKHPSGETKHPLGEQSASKFSPQEIYKVNNTSASWQLLTHISLDQSTGKMEACG